MHHKSYMKTVKALSMFGSALILALFCGTPALADTLLVDDDKTECPDAGFKHIQNAVNQAAPGDIIEVCPGVYDEQVKIAKPLSLVGVRRDGKKAAVVQPSNMTANATDIFGGSVAAAILVKGTSDVTIRNITVDGINNGLGCELTDPFLSGIFYRNSSGQIEFVAVRNMRSPQGCAEGIGIDIESSEDGVSRLTVRDSSIHDYDLSGIFGPGAGTDIQAIRNVITSNGPTLDFDFPQSGIRMIFGATGVIEDNIVTNHVFAPCTPSECLAAAVNIRVSGTEGVRIVGNIVGKSNFGIIVGNVTGGSILENKVFDTDVLHGIALLGDNNTVKDNIITNSDGAGVAVAGANNTIQDNTINEATIGLLVSTGNNVSDNWLFNTPVTKEVFDPGASAGSSQGSLRPGVIPSPVSRRGLPR